MPRGKQKLEVASSADGKRVALAIADGVNPEYVVELTPETAAQLAVGILETLKKLRASR